MVVPYEHSVFSEQIIQWLQILRPIWDVACQEVQRTQQLLKLVLIRRWFHVDDGADFVGVCFDLPIFDDVAQELDFLRSKRALFFVERHFGLLDTLQNLD